MQPNIFIEDKVISKCQRLATPQLDSVSNPKAHQAALLCYFSDRVIEQNILTRLPSQKQIWNYTSVYIHITYTTTAQSPGS